MQESIYKNSGDKVSTIQQESQSCYVIERIEGTLRYIKGSPYPQKGMPTPESVWAGNQAKILFREGLYFLKTPRIIQTKYLEKLIQKYNLIASKATIPYILKRECQHPFAKEVGDMTYDFLTKIGIQNETAEKFAENFNFIFEADNAYVIRAMDVLSETSKDLMLKNPRKEIRRMIILLRQRDTVTSVIDKFENVQKLIALMLYVPKYKKAFVETIQNSIFTHLQYDEADRYWAHFREDYNCFGKTFEERLKMIIDAGLPVCQKYNVAHYSKEDMDKMIADGTIEMRDGMWTKVK